MDGEATRGPPYEAAAAVAAWAAVNWTWCLGRSAREGFAPPRAPALDRTPATLGFAVLYSLAVEEGRWAETREQLDERLEAAVAPTRDTWGRLPSHQRAMRKAQTMGGGGQAG